MKVKSYLGGDVIIVEKELPAREIIYRYHQKLYKKRKPRKVMTIEERKEARRKSREKEYKRLRKVRRERLKLGICTYCAKGRPDEGRHQCPECLRQSRLKCARWRERKLILESYGV